MRLRRTRLLLIRLLAGRYTVLVNARLTGSVSARYRSIHDIGSVWASSDRARPDVPFHPALWPRRWPITARARREHD